MDSSAAAEMGMPGVGRGGGGPGYWGQPGTVAPWDEEYVGFGLGNGGDWTSHGPGARNGPPGSFGERGPGQDGQGGRGMGSGPPFNKRARVENGAAPVHGFPGGGEPGMMPPGEGPGGGWGGGPGPGPAGDPGTGAGRGRGSIFFRTKLCSKWRNGTCPYISNCNFAHSMEELRKPPPGWEDFVSPDKLPSAKGGLGGGTLGGGEEGAAVPGRVDGSGNSAASTPQGAPGTAPQETSLAAGDGGKAGSRQRPCNKFLSDSGCPYGDRCLFLHERAPNPSGLGGAGASVEGGSSRATAPAAPSGAVNKPPNWRTRICNKWETTGSCPFTDKCYFAHGALELQRFGGGPAEVQAGSDHISDGMPGSVSSFAESGAAVSGPATGLRGSMVPRRPVPPGQPNRSGPASTAAAQKGDAKVGAAVKVGVDLKGAEAASGTVTTSKLPPNWKGPRDGISTVYGDWLDDHEWGPPAGKDLSRKPSATSKEHRMAVPFFKVANNHSMLTKSGHAGV